MYGTQGRDTSDPTERMQFRRPSCEGEGVLKAENKLKELTQY